VSIALDKRVTAFFVVVLDFSQGIEEFWNFEFWDYSNSDVPKSPHSHCLRRTHSL
jgi:hypothetical protein